MEEKTWWDRILVPGWQKCWKWFEVHLALVASLVVGWVFSSPLELLALLNGIPPEYRARLSPIVVIVVFLIVVAARLIKQKRALK